MESSLLIMVQSGYSVLIFVSKTYCYLVLTFGQVHKEAGYALEGTDSASKNIKKTALKMHRFNEHVARDPRVEVVILPIFDGLSLIRRKTN